MVEGGVARHADEVGKVLPGETELAVVGPRLGPGEGADLAVGQELGIGIRIGVVHRRLVRVLLDPRLWGAGLRAPKKERFSTSIETFRRHDGSFMRPKATSPGPVQRARQGSGCCGRAVYLRVRLTLDNYKNFMVLRSGLQTASKETVTSRCR
jgi:hypothetical protein